MKTLESPQVFISYAHDDLDIVHRLYTDLKERGVNLWFDKENMEPGRWKTQIQKVIPKSRFFLFCISNSALEKTERGSGFIDDELQQAYEIAMMQDERHFTIVPVRIEKELSRGDHRLSIFQQYDLFEDWEREVDKLAVYLGGKAFASVIEKKEQSENEILIDSLRGKADAAFHGSQYDKALLFYDALVSLKPDDAKAWCNKGIALSELRRYADALSAFGEALRYQPKDAETWYGIGVARTKLSRHEEALFAYEEAIELQPEYADAWHNKGFELGALGRYEEELEAYAEALKYEPNNASTLSNMGHTLAILGRYQEGMAAIEKSLMLNPNDADAWDNKGFTLSCLNRHQEALRAIQMAVQIDPELAIAWYNKGVALKALGREDDATKAFERARELGFE